MLRNENCKFRAKTLKADEAVSDSDTARRPEKFVPPVRDPPPERGDSRNLQFAVVR